MKRKIRKYKLSLILSICFAILVGIFLHFSTAQAGDLLPYPKFQAFDSSGDPLSGGLLYTYIAGTSTAKASYSDKDLSTANTNPVVLDSNGEATVYLNGTYKLILKDSDGVSIWTLDDISGIFQSSGTTLYVTSTIQIGTGQSAVSVFAISGTSNIPGYALALNDTGTEVIFIPPTGLNNLAVNSEFGVMGNSDGIYPTVISFVSGYVSASGVSFTILTRGAFSIGDHVSTSAGFTTDGAGGLGETDAGTSVYEITAITTDGGSWYLTVDGDAIVSGSVSGVTDIFLVMPCQTAADNDGPDGFYTTITLDTCRSPLSGVSKAGTAYTLYMKKGAAGDEVVYQYFSGITNAARGKEMSVGIYALAYAASNTRIELCDDDGCTASTYNSGVGAFEWGEATRTIATDTNSVYWQISNDNDSGDTSYATGPCLVFGGSIGAGNCVKPPGEYIPFETTNILNNFAADTFSDVAKTTLNLEVESRLMIPKNVKAVNVIMYAKDSDTSTGNPDAQIYGLDNTQLDLYIILDDALTGRDGINTVMTGLVSTDVNGDLAYLFTASGTDTLTVSIRVNAVYLH